MASHKTKTVKKLTVRSVGKHAANKPHQAITATPRSNSK